MAENLDIRLTVEAWAEIVIKNWQAKILQMGITNTFQLADSFAHHIISNAGGDVERVEFAFLFYGRFIDMGVGNGISINDVSSGNHRRPRKWYSKTLYSEFQKLVSILAEKYALKTAKTIVENIEGATVSKT